MENSPKNEVHKTFRGVWAINRRWCTTYYACAFQLHGKRTNKECVAPNIIGRVGKARLFLYKKFRLTAKERLVKKFSKNLKKVTKNA